MKFLDKLLKRDEKVEKVDIRRRFELLARVGQGSMSRVWRARDTMSGQIVALKVLDKAKTARLERRFVGLDKPTEGEIAVALKHPNVVRTIEHGITTDDEQYLVMEFIEGVGLSFLIDAQNERMAENRIFYMVQLADAIDYLHRRKWIHRDICPRNVMVTEEEHIKLIDFGLVVPNSEPFRAPGNRTGTPIYMAPELIKRQRTDERIDIFSFAVSCYEMYTQKMPWPAGDTLESVMQHINQPPRDIRKLVPGIDDSIADVIMRGLAPNPDDRWRTAREMGEALWTAGEQLGMIPAEEE
ncbi:MAG: serine/threonine protein kinase [Planctomycetota bacterium]|nr:MAG: serine/threonine protein kinase [Planctomycetota bacterium]REJ85962.1 MAG: serine/threonine protein kinase [Planctomycetota bacterium]REK28504.1 MAG: serine/threonine protein kinase [Planctomycetota bacterium]REK29076.1 MAG: serine/threonine protein kinase [Planctomycetota bacterium]